MDYRQEQMNAARRLYDSPLGHKVLAHLLSQMFFYTITESVEEMVLKNFATDYMAALGFSQDNAVILTEAIMKMPRKKEQEDA